MKLDDEYQRLAAAASDRVAKILENEGAQAKALFTRITERHGLGTAKLLFERCIKLANEPSTEEEQEQRAAEKAKAKAAQRVRAMTNLPTVEKVAVADRRQLCIWWYRLPARKFSTRERCACYSRGQSSLTIKQKDRLRAVFLYLPMSGNRAIMPFWAFAKWIVWELPWSLAEWLF